MASHISDEQPIQADSSHQPGPFTATGKPAPGAWDVVRIVLRPLSSLKLTVALFAMSILIVFAGTLAQVDKDIWEVVEDYFRMDFTSPWTAVTSSMAVIDIQVFFPASFFPEMPRLDELLPSWMPHWFPFPKGWLIGLVMGMNLVAAHLVRFKIGARGTRLWGGLGVIALGCLVTYMVIAAGMSSEGFQDQPLLSWEALWIWFKLGLGALCGTCVFALLRIEPERKIERWGLGVLTAVLGGLFFYYSFGGGEAALSDSSMRILWHLVKASVASWVLLAGCFLVFRKRAGIVLLHAGVALMMFSELLVGTTAVEGQMQIAEGETVNFVQDIRTVELAFVSPADKSHEDMVVIPKHLLVSAEIRTEHENRIEHENLPFDVTVGRYYPNSALRRPLPDDENPATSGVGLQNVVVERPAGTGTDVNSKVDIASMYVTLADNDSGKPLGTYLMSQHLLPQKIAASNGKTYEVELRFKRTYKPYSVYLHDVSKTDYLGTSKPRDYTSMVHIVDPEAGIDRDNVRIWMNNPLRFAGETFYQSGYDVNTSGIEVTSLQVVTNTGWMIPYVSCMIVVFGLVFQFGLTLARFLDRQARAAPAVASEIPDDSKPPMLTPPAGRKRRRKQRSGNQRERPVEPAAGTARWNRPEFLAPVIAVAVALLIIFTAAMPLGKPKDEMDIHRFGKLPLVYQGRTKPFDTLAGNTLRIISGKLTFKDADNKSQPAIRWLLDVMARPDVAAGHEIFRIENLEVLDTLGLKRRKGYRYSHQELVASPGKYAQFHEDARRAWAVQKEDAKQLTFYQRKVIEVDRKIRTYTLVQAAFRPRIDQEDTAAENREAALRAHRDLVKHEPPLSVPMVADDGDAESMWIPYASAMTFAYLSNFAPDPATMNFTKILVAYGKNDPNSFNDALAEYESYLAEHPRDDLNQDKVDFEAYFNQFEPFYWASVLYLVGFVLVALSWLGWRRPLARAALALIMTTFVLHTLALVARMYISGRPPVTNLYSSAVFIGWAAVLFGIVIELIFRLGIGSVLSSVTGFGTLLIAHFLSLDGDTFTVLQAVLDTQFWLATHVVCVTLGYATTFVAGALGMIYIIAGMTGGQRLDADMPRVLTRMIYGTLCFALLFSFFGTVLGGLWADDSWGRFWGWDPKENGALMIVLWNALILHARWGGMVAGRGLAVLAVAGNIVTSWSWFGVNELGIGLHSYGFTEGVLLALLMFVFSQLTLIGLGTLYKPLWCRSITK